MVGRPQPNSDTSVDLTRRYLAELGSYPLLTAEDEATLAQAISDGRVAEDKLADTDTTWSRRERSKLQASVRAAAEARRRFIQSNLRLVVSIAKRYQTPSMSLLDLIQEGNLGLMRAVEKFDHRKGFKFSTYATWWIRQAISRAIADKGRTIRIPIHIDNILKKLDGAQRKLEAQGDREITIEEIADMAGVDPVEADVIMRAAQQLVSLDKPVGDDSDAAQFGDLIPDESSASPFDEAVESMRDERLKACLDNLPYRDKRILELRFGLGGEAPQTLDKVAKLFQLTRERTRQIEEGALRKLSTLAEAQGLREAA